MGKVPTLRLLSVYCVLVHSQALRIHNQDATLAVDENNRTRDAIEIYRFDRDSTHLRTRLEAEQLTQAEPSRLAVPRSDMDKQGQLEQTSIRGTEEQPGRTSTTRTTDDAEKHVETSTIVGSQEQTEMPSVGDIKEQSEAASDDGGKPDHSEELRLTDTQEQFVTPRSDRTEEQSDMPSMTATTSPQPMTLDGWGEYMELMTEVGKQNLQQSTGKTVTTLTTVEDENKNDDNPDDLKLKMETMTTSVTLTTNTEGLSDSPAVPPRSNILSGLQTYIQHANIPHDNPDIRKRKPQQKIPRTEKRWSAHNFKKSNDNPKMAIAQGKYSDMAQDNDYDEYEDDDGVYTLAHYRQEVYDYIDDRLAETNNSVMELLLDMHKKITQLENQLATNVAYMCSLETRLRGGVNSQQGDVRLLSSDRCGQVTRAGYLQFYTGSNWGFVCDDFFDSAAAKVACRQLGFPESDGNVSLNHNLIDHRRISESEKSWMENFNIVLDDVNCLGDEKTLGECGHYHLGNHDCSKQEIVYLSC